MIKVPGERLCTVCGKSVSACRNAIRLGPAKRRVASGSDWGSRRVH
jgi:hypothetical protein